MPIDKSFLVAHGESQLVVMSPDQPLQAALDLFKARGYAENQAYLVVQMGAKEATATCFAEVIPQVIKPLGYESFSTPLGELPLPLADKVVRTDIAQSGLKVLDWVAARPQSRLVVVDDSGVVGLLTNPNRSGGGGHFDGLSLLGLHGESHDSTKNYDTFTRLVPPPTCPHCQHKGFAKFKGGKYTCAQCSHQQDKPW